MCHINLMEMRKCFSVAMERLADPGVALAGLLAEVAGFAGTTDLSEGDVARLAIVIEELASNALRHGQAHALSFDIAAGEDSVDIRFIDDGRRFDPAETGRFEGPDPQSGGGVGLQLVRSWCEPLVYRRTGKRNVLEARLRREKRAAD